MPVDLRVFKVTVGLALAWVGHMMLGTARWPAFKAVRQSMPIPCAPLTPARRT